MAEYGIKPSAQPVINRIMELTRNYVFVADWKLAVFNEAYCFKPLRTDGSAFVLQFVNRKAWMSVAPNVLATLRKQGWSFRQVRVWRSLGGNRFPAYAIEAAEGPVYAEATCRETENWVQRLLSHPD